jgi:hypothetical protein
MWLWFVTMIGLDENENETCAFISSTTNGIQQ